MFPTNMTTLLRTPKLPRNTCGNREAIQKKRCCRRMDIISINQKNQPSLSPTLSLHHHLQQKPTTIEKGICYFDQESRRHQRCCSIFLVLCLCVSVLISGSVCETAYVVVPLAVGRSSSLFALSCLHWRVRYKLKHDFTDTSVIYRRVIHVT